MRAQYGHMTRLKGPVHAFGKISDGQIQPEKNGKVSYCLQCIEAMTIQCAWCGEHILPGEPITLYTPRDKNYTIPEGAVTYSQDPLRLVGCLRFDCAQTGADRAGFWVPPGQVEPVMSPLEACMLSGGVVVVPDMGRKDVFISIKRDTCS